MADSLAYNAEARIVSPHADDAALSLAGHIAPHYQNVRVLTVFTRSSSHILGGIGEDTRTVSAMRDMEDANFCAEMDWQLERGGLPDSEVRGIAWDDVHAAVDPQLVEQIAALIMNFTKGTRFDLYIPAAIGLHPDHYAVVRAIGSVAHQITCPTYVYADIPYALTQQPLVHHGNESLKTPDATASNPSMKAAVLALYPSQISPGRLQWVASNDHEQVWHVGEAYFTAARLRGQEGRTTLFDQSVWSKAIALAYQHTGMKHLDIKVGSDDSEILPVTIQHFNLPNGRAFSALRLRASLATDYSRTPTEAELEELRQLASKNGVDVIWLSNMPEDTISDELFSHGPASHELFTNNSTTGIACALSFDQWLGELSRNARRMLKRKMDKLEDYAQVQRLELQHTYELLDQKSLEQFFAMQKRRAQSHDTLDALQDNQEFATLLRLIAGTGTMHVAALRVGGATIAMSLVHFDLDTKTVSVLAQAFEPEWQEYSPGIVNMVHLIRNAHENHYSYIDLLRGDEGYKTHIINTTRRLMKYIEMIGPLSASDYASIKDYIKSYEE